MEKKIKILRWFRFLWWHWFLVWSACECILISTITKQLNLICDIWQPIPLYLWNMATKTFVTNGNQDLYTCETWRPRPFNYVIHGDQNLWTIWYMLIKTWRFCDKWRSRPLDWWHMATKTFGLCYTLRPNPLNST